jgi:hypothetical protein
MNSSRWPALGPVLLGALCTGAAAGPVKADTPRPFTITVVDEQTSRGVPLVELRTVNEICAYTDSNGVAAIYEPGLMGQLVFFHVRSHGYEFAKDGFGYRGQALHVTTGGSATLKIKRLNLAERLYRVTGGGIYRDSVLLGRPVPVREPLLNARVFGSDSVVNAVYRSRLHWFWGDTNRPAYPLGNFHVPGATSLLPGRGGLDPEVGVELTYFTDEKGFARPTARMPGDGPTWIDGLVVLRDEAGRERLFAAYVKIRAPLTVYARGLAEFDDAAQAFNQAVAFKMGAPAYPGGHPFHHTEDSVDYVYFADPYPLTRVRASPGHLKDLASYETFTCLKEGSRLEKPEIDRKPDGRARYAWKRNTPAVGPAEQQKLIQAGHLKHDEAWLHLQDRDTGKPVLAHRGSVYWNSYRRRWVLITVQSGGTSFLGEVWYAEGDSPLGPWVYALKVVTHDRYSFYNPKQHPMFDKHGGRTIFFEGTYTHAFSGNPERTPRYDYNQVLYKLDLTDSRLALPVAVYDLSTADKPNRFTTLHGQGRKEGRREIAFFALDRPVKGMVPVYSATPNSPGGLRVGKPLASAERADPDPLFYALPVDVPDPAPTTTPLYEYVHEDGKRHTSATNPSLVLPGFQRSAKPLCRVWRSPEGLRNRISFHRPGNESADQETNRAWAALPGLYLLPFSAGGTGSGRKSRSRIIHSCSAAFSSFSTVPASKRPARFFISAGSASRSYSSNIGRVGAK